MVATRTAFERELNLARELAVQAGHIILSHYDTDYSIELKAGKEPVTIADRSSSQHIVKRLAQAFPQDLILSEELVPPVGLQNHERVWIIDPMDGTGEFINHSGEFAVMIGLVESGQPVLGVIHQPVTGFLYWAVRGHGAYFNSGRHTRLLRVSTRRDFSQLRIAASRSHFTQELRRLYHQLGIQEVVRSGSVGLKLALIARQSCDLYLNLSGLTSCWDTCAPQILLTEAGGLVSNLSGQPLDYSFKQLRNLNGVVASNGVVHSLLLERIQALLEEYYRTKLAQIHGEEGLA